MKKLLAVTALLVGFAIASNAQQSRPTTKETKKEEKQKMKDELNLSKDQEAKIKDLNKDYKTRAIAIKKNSNLSEEQKKEQLKSLHREQAAKTNAILTPEQQAKRDQWKKEKHHKKNHKKEAVTK